MSFDPSVFDPKNISQETAAFNEMIHNTISAMPPTYTQPPQKIRDDREAGLGLWPVNKLDEVSDRDLPV
ncbi:MAG: hypothetical protein ABIK68_20255, partial [bacterium]